MPILTTTRRGLRGYKHGSSPIPVYSFVAAPGPLSPASACGCHKRKHKRLGDDGDDFNFGFPSGLIPPGVGGNLANVPGTVSYPASPESGLSYVPTSDIPISGNPQYTPINTMAYSVSSGGVMPVLNNPQASGLSMGGSILTPSGPLAFLGGSSTTLLLGGLGLLAVVMFAAGGRKRR